MPPRRLLLVSSSTCHPRGYLDHCEAQVRSLFSDARQILFIPFARPSGSTYEAYTGIARKRFAKMGMDVTGIHEHADAREAVSNAEGVFIGGGNTFVLLQQLYARDLTALLRDRIESGMPYMGTSAGSNVAGLSIGTSNDMPIVCPPSFDALGVVPWNLNPHYPSAAPDPTHKGETRDDRIAEFHVFNYQPVLALHEDGMVRIEGERIELVGQRDALLFHRDKEVRRIAPGEISRESFTETR